MNEMNLLEEFRAVVAPPDAAMLAQARARVLDGGASGRESRRARGPRPPGSWPKPALTGLAAAATAATVTGLAAALIVTSGPAQPPGAGTGPAFAPAATGAAVLRNAALAALAEPAATPQPNQFVYSKVYARQTGGPKSQAAMPGTAVYQTWLSVSGTRAGLASQTGGWRPGTQPEAACKNGRVVPASLGWPRSARLHCSPADFAGYLPGMPTRPGALRAWLDRRYHVRPGPAGVIVLTEFTEQILFTSILTPAQHAAMYELLARTTGLKAVPKATTLLGHTGVGVRWTLRVGETLRIGGTPRRGEHDSRPVMETYTLVFNRKTYAVLGMNWTGPSGASGGEALIKRAIVGKPGQLP